MTSIPRMGTRKLEKGGTGIPIPSKGVLAQFNDSPATHVLLTPSHPRKIFTGTISIPHFVKGGMGVKPGQDGKPEMVVKSVRPVKGGNPVKGVKVGKSVRGGKPGKAGKAFFWVWRMPANNMC
jgi:hypothetical protein